MAQPRDQRPLPAHSAVDKDAIRTMTIYGHTGPCAKVTCPHCGEVRWTAMRVLRRQLGAPAFTGSCRPCWNSLPKGRRFRTNRNPSGRRVGANGYICLSKNAVTDDELDLFDVMRRRGGYVQEHRWIMAKHLGRALTSNELVDHMNGQKTDNRIENLRMYVRGKQEPGSAPGHGTYYHEWQMALCELRMLRGF